MFTNNYSKAINPLIFRFPRRTCREKAPIVWTAVSPFVMPWDAPLITFVSEWNHAVYKGQWAEPAAFYHRFHRWIWKLFGKKLPQE